jgi:TolA-binding protein
MMMGGIIIPLWFWGIIGSVFFVMLCIIGWSISYIINRSKEDIQKTNDDIQKAANEAIKIKDEAKLNVCSFHQNAFERVHSEREKTTDCLSKSISELNGNINELKNTSNELSVHLKYIKEKHEDNKKQIDNLDDRVSTLELKVK